MATKQDIVDAIHGELVDLIGVTIGVSDPERHVRLANRDGDTAVPAYTVEIFESAVNNGLGGGAYVAGLERNADGTTTVRAGREMEATVDIGVHAAGGRQRTVNELYQALEQRFTTLATRFSTFDALHPDVQTLEANGSQDIGSPTDNLVGDRYRLTVEYDNEYVLGTVPTMRNVGVEVGAPLTELDEQDVLINTTIDTTIDT